MHDETNVCVYIFSCPFNCVETDNYDADKHENGQNWFGGYGAQGCTWVNATDSNFTYIPKVYMEIIKIIRDYHFTNKALKIFKSIVIQTIIYFMNYYYLMKMCFFFKQLSK